MRKTDPFLLTIGLNALEEDNNRKITSINPIKTKGFIHNVQNNRWKYESGVWNGVFISGILDAGRFNPVLVCLADIGALSDINISSVHRKFIASKYWEIHVSAFLWNLKTSWTERESVTRACQNKSTTGLDQT